MDAAVAGLIGAGLGLVGSLGAVWIQNHYLSKRERAKSVMEIAARSREQEVSLVVAGARRRNIPPIEVFVQHHQSIFEMLESGEVTAGKIEKIFSEKERMASHLEAVSHRRWVEEATDKAIEQAGG